MFNLITRGEVIEKVTTLGIDLAKSVFSLHGVDGAGQVVLRRTVRRDQLAKVVALTSEMSPILDTRCPVPVICFENQCITALHTCMRAWCAAVLCQLSQDRRPGGKK